eukprot:Hpha_TRINITY_DN16153_c3_g5::TRINITY_DN16153_c3_g5_i1::g.4305::m.4305
MAEAGKLEAELNSLRRQRDSGLLNPQQYKTASDAIVASFENRLRTAPSPKPSPKFTPNKARGVNLAHQSASRGRGTPEPRSSAGRGELPGPGGRGTPAKVHPPSLSSSPKSVPPAGASQDIVIALRRPDSFSDWGIVVTKQNAVLNVPSGSPAASSRLRELVGKKKTVRVLSVDGKSVSSRDELTVAMQGKLHVRLLCGTCGAVSQGRPSGGRGAPTGPGGGGRGAPASPPPVAPHPK